MKIFSDSQTVAVRCVTLKLERALRVFVVSHALPAKRRPRRYIHHAFEIEQNAELTALRLTFIVALPVRVIRVHDVDV